jgi:hypothetical protein
VNAERSGPYLDSGICIKAGFETGMFFEICSVHLAREATAVARESLECDESPFVEH